jgi:RND family efflux transporter MFP subunit
LRLALCISAVALLAFLCSCAGDSKAAGEKKEKAADRRYSVKTATASVRPLKYELETTGSLQADDIFRIDAQVAGVIQDVAFKEGDEVTEKTVLCRIAPSTYALAAQRAKDAWQRAKDAWQKAVDDLEDTKRKTRNDIQRLKLRLEQAERDVARRQPAFDSKAVSEDEFLTVVDRRDAAIIELKDVQEAAVTLVKAMQSAAIEKGSEAKQAETEWKQAEEDLSKSSVVSPVAGTIDVRYAGNGTRVTPGTGSSTTSPIAQVVSKGLKLKFTLPEQESAHVSEGTPLVFRVMAYPGRDFAAKIYYISNLADPKTRLVTCWAKVEPADAVLKSGFFATVKIITQEKKSAVVIPLSAAQPTEFGFIIYVIEPSKDAKDVLRAERRKVTLGLQVVDKAVEVIEGLKEGEVFAVEGANALSDGVLVKESQPAPEKKDAAAGTPKSGTADERR